MSLANRSPGTFAWFITAAGGVLLCIVAVAKCEDLTPPTGRMIRQAGDNGLKQPQPAVYTKAMQQQQEQQQRVVDETPTTPPTLPNEALDVPQQQHADKEKPASSGQTDFDEGDAVSSYYATKEVKNAEAEFLKWSKTALGVETILEIKTFQYHDHLQDYLTENMAEDDDWGFGYASFKEKKRRQEALVRNDTESFIPVRGLAATRHIAAGEVLIRIPVHGLLSVTTTIDQDPFLSPLMGPQARREYGWNLIPNYDDSDKNLPLEDAEQMTFLFELSLLAIAVLYHRNMGAESPLAPYIQILESTDVSSMPFLWPKERFEDLSPSAGLRSVATGIHRDIRDMFETVMEFLVEKHPKVFGRPTNASDEEWMFSYQNFQWAFAIVNSRHWQLPIADLGPAGETDSTAAATDSDSATATTTPPSDATTANPPAAGVVDSQVPPADMPTEEWAQQGDHDDIVPMLPPTPPRSSAARRNNMPPLEHSFLAPVADLLNFGPSCTRGRFDEETHTFEIIASCPFMEGQEVTFWYSDECDDVIAGMYGFLHPMIPQCPTAEEYRTREEEWRRRAELLEEELDQAYSDLENLHEELHTVEGILESRDKSSSRLRHEKTSVRGSHSSRDDNRIRSNHGIRRMNRSRRSEF